MSLLEVKNLSVRFESRRGEIRPVDSISFQVERGKTLGIVGQSGCGKSLTSLALMGLLPPQAELTADRLSFDGQNLVGLSEKKRRKLRGRAMSMIFQDPMSSLNPSFSVGFQLMEVLRGDRSLSKAERQKEAIRLLGRVGIAEPESRLRAYPHQLSGGMSQRVMIAMAIACRPQLLIADEPTTALDVTIQSQILRLLNELIEENNMALILITHDIAVVGEVADDVVVMYAGQIVESGTAADVISMPRHPYTEGLLRCLPQLGTERKALLPSIPGLVPDLSNRPGGCQFEPRCNYADEKCRRSNPGLEKLARQEIRCHYPTLTEKEVSL